MGPGRMNLHTHAHMPLTSSSSREREVCNLQGKSGTDNTARCENSFSGHVPRWRLSRLQNLATSPLATILPFEKQPRSERGQGVTEHLGERLRLWLRKGQKSLIHCSASAGEPPSQARPLRLQPQMAAARAAGGNS